MDAPDQTLAALTGVAVLAVLAFPLTWRAARNVVTVVHELGHALMTLLLGGRVQAVRLNMDSSGWAASSFRDGPLWRPRMALVTGSGYPAPAAAAAVGAWLLANGFGDWWLPAWVAIAATTLVLWVRNLWGVVLLGGIAGGIGWLVFSGAAPDGAVDVVGLVLVWLLAVGGFRASVEHYRTSRHDKGTDARNIASYLRIPWPITAVGMILATAGALAGTAFLLLGQS